MVIEKLRRTKRSVDEFLALAGRLERCVSELSTRIDALSSKVELGDVPAELIRDRESAEFARPYEAPSPLVTICIATYNRSDLVVTRAIRSALGQDYKNIQVMVVGDGCTDDTAERVARVRDSRVCFYNLPERGRYPDRPDHPECRWMVAGTAAMNEALRRAEGAFVTHLDDDDEHLPERVSSLLEVIQRTRAELVFHPFWYQRQDYTWGLNTASAMRLGAVSTGSVFYHRWFSRIHWDMDAYRLNEPGDWNRLRKFLYLGAKLERHEAPLLRHYREGSQRKP